MGEFSGVIDCFFGQSVRRLGLQIISIYRLNMACGVVYWGPIMDIFSCYQWSHLAGYGVWGQRMPSIASGAVFPDNKLPEIRMSYENGCIGRDGRQAGKNLISSFETEIVSYWLLKFCVSRRHE